MGGIVSGIFGGGNAAEDAATIQSQSADKGVAEQRRQFDITQKTLKPSIEAGTQALAIQQALLGFGSPEEQTAAMSDFNESPAQQFIRQRQEKALVANASATGGLGGANIQTALQEQAANIAGSQYGEYYNRLAGLSGTGQQAASTQGQLGANMASNIQQGYNASGQAQASGILGAQQANAAIGQQVLGAGVGAGLGALGMAGAGVGAGGGALLGLLSDKNMKHDIEDLDPKECYDIVQGLDLKAWRYLERTGLDQGVHFGPMAQDAPKCIKIEGHEMLDLHDELMLIAGALQYLESQKCLH
tara:strand:- start:333 stop:1238 length:906 start_codon:yes stop_codon:yes gene_type:complete